MTKVVMVVSAFGLGHLTRQIALKDALMTINPELQIVMVISEDHDKLLRRAILTSERVQIEYLPIMPKMALNTWLEIDVESTKESYLRFWEWETQIRDDTEWGRILRDADLIINDIECVHNPIANKMNIHIINISNFLWSDILDGFGFSDLASNYLSWESLAKTHIKLPMSARFGGLETLDYGLMRRKVNQDRVTAIKSRSSRPLVFLSYSGSQWGINIDEYIDILHNNNFRIIMHERFFNDNNTSDIQPILMKSDDPNTQDYYAAADLVVSKLGYGTVSEAIGGGTSILFWKRKHNIEDDVMADYIVRHNYGEELPEECPPELLIEVIKRWLDHSYDPEPNDVDNIAVYINELLTLQNTP